METPKHPGEPKWKTHSEWLRTGDHKSIEVEMTEEQSRDDLLERFGLTDDPVDNGWGTVDNDSSDANFGGGWTKTDPGMAGYKIDGSIHLLCTIASVAFFRFWMAIRSFNDPDDDAFISMDDIDASDDDEDVSKEEEEEDADNTSDTCIPATEDQ
ncbi:hypothetical protein DFQ29_002675 [Apophysomyces sp. BC1021]|nr:hypothetical protein DFQ29_002675 [Apophysomyces sp. BC1021]